MEDLAGYIMKKRQTGLDMNHMEKAIEWMAKYHAASMVYFDLNGAFGAMFEDGVFSNVLEDQYEKIYSVYYDRFFAAIKTLPDGRKYVEKLVNRLMQNIWNNILQLYIQGKMA